ncbi:MAG: XRE family transcriptional regulator [Proteobacteria bacterium]|nr:XRE family transcriptional regulator [Pseudomonadota bacterium]
MAKPFSNLRNKMPIKAQQAAEMKAKKLLAEMALQALRHARHLSQECIAKILGTKQANISRLEKRTDMYISTLRSYVKAMGGELDIIARFPEGEVRINQFEEIELPQEAKEV